MWMRERRKKKTTEVRVQEAERGKHKTRETDKSESVRGPPEENLKETKETEAQKRVRVSEAVERRDGGRERISVCAQIDSDEDPKYQHCRFQHGKVQQNWLHGLL